MRRVRNIQAWDAGPTFADRITVRIETTNSVVIYFGLSDHNVGPNGVNMVIGNEELDGKPHGRKLKRLPLETVRGLLNRGI